jgi:hypothetical protein
MMNDIDIIEYVNDDYHQIAFLPSLPSPYSQDETTSLSLYSDDTEWLSALLTSGPNGLGLYFYDKVQENDTSHGFCSLREIDSSNKSNQSMNEKSMKLPTSFDIFEWIKSAIKYGLFAVAVLIVNKFRRYHMERRKRLHSSSSSNEDDDTFDDIVTSHINRQLSSSSGRRNSSISTLKASTSNLLPIEVSQ